MRLGVVADIHANKPALEAVLVDMPAVDAVTCAGDVVGYGPMPVVCVERIRSVVTTTVRGNHDRLVNNPEQFVTIPMTKASLEEHPVGTLRSDPNSFYCFAVNCN